MARKGYESVSEVLAAEKPTKAADRKLVGKHNQFLFVILSAV